MVTATGFDVYVSQSFAVIYTLEENWVASSGEPIVVGMQMLSGEVGREKDVGVGLPGVFPGTFPASRILKVDVVICGYSYPQSGNISIEIRPLRNAINP